MSFAARAGSETHAPEGALDDAVAFLSALVRDDPRPYAERALAPRLPIAPLLERVGDPHRRLSVVHVAGSKGKGSTALLLERILESAGVRTGTFTSPHLERWTERYRVGGREIPASVFAHTVSRLRPHVSALQAASPASAPGFFDVLTAAGFLVFDEAEVEVAIVETGIGGRLDATNVVSPRVSCITSVELEHTDKLGDTITAVAREKAGIIKPGTPLVLGPLPAEAERVAREHAARARAPVAAMGEDIIVERLHGAGEDPRVAIDVAGRRYQTALAPGIARPPMSDNAALAVACAQLLALPAARELGTAVSRALCAAHLPGRLEIAAERPWIVVDGAHTRASVDALAKTLDHLPPRRRHFVVSVTARKDAAMLLRVLLARAASVTVTAADPTRSLDARSLADILASSGIDRARLHAVPDPREAIRGAIDRVAEDELLCVAGSMYLAGVARGVLAIRP